MRGKASRIARIAAATFLMIAAGSCNDINRQTSPVTLVVTNTQDLHHIDLGGGTGCDQNIGTVHMQSIVVQGTGSTLTPNPLLTPADLNSVQIDRYRVSYVRIDGGHLVPAPFVRSISTFISPGSTSNATSFVVFDPNALNQAPFAALLTQNGGRDPETGKTIISMDVILQVFGQTLAGERVSGSTRMTLDFCISCNGCF